MSNNAVLMDFNMSSQNLGVKVAVRDLDGDCNVEIEALTTQDTTNAVYSSCSAPD